MEQCTSAGMVTGVMVDAPLEKYRSRCLLPHHGWQLQSLRACSLGTVQMPLGCQHQVVCIVFFFFDAHATVTPAV
jgi:hypothetical protein